MGSLEAHEDAEKPRTLARRRQVLDAASRCFRLHGFHACSMAQISAEAGMSAGHIYRYFTGKDAIIAAIVRQDVDEIVSEMAESIQGAEDLRAVLVERAEEGVRRASRPEEASLTLEISAEAARNPVIRALVRECDDKISDQLRGMIAAAVGREMAPDELTARVEMFHLVYQGVGIRTAINAEIDRSALAQLVKLMIDAILR